MDLKDYKLPTPNPKSKATERGELLKFFMEQLNLDLGGRKPYTIPRVAYLFAHLKKEDLYYLKSSCSQSLNFNKCVLGSIKIKKK